MKIKPLTQEQDISIRNAFEKDGSYPYWVQDLEPVNLTDARESLDKGVMLGIVSEPDAGIIGYIHAAYSEDLVSMMNLFAAHQLEKESLQKVETTYLQSNQFYPTLYDISKLNHRQLTVAFQDAVTSAVKDGREVSTVQIDVLAKVDDIWKNVTLSANINSEDGYTISGISATSDDLIDYNGCNGPGEMTPDTGVTTKYFDHLNAADLMPFIEVW